MENNLNSLISVFLFDGDKCNVDTDLSFVSSNMLGRAYSAIVTINNLKIHIRKIDDAIQIRDELAKLITEWENEIS